MALEGAKWIFAVMLEVKDATVSVEGRKLIENLSFVAADSETFCIVGAHGQGKSLLLKALMGLHPLDNGHVSIDGELLSPASALEFRRRIVSYVPQSLVVDGLTVGRLSACTFALSANKGKPLSRTLLVEEWARLGLEKSVYDKRFSELSSGDRQRALLGIVGLLLKPIVIVDEPVAGLDSHGVSLVSSYLHRMAERGQTVVVASCDESLGGLCHKRLIL